MQAKYFRQKLTGLRNAIDDLLRELPEEQAPEAAPRKRRNLRELRIEDLQTNLAMGTWRKPKHQKKIS